MLQTGLQSLATALWRVRCTTVRMGYWIGVHPIAIPGGQNPSQ